MQQRGERCKGLGAESCLGIGVEERASSAVQTNCPDDRTQRLGARRCEQLAGDSRRAGPSAQPTLAGTRRNHRLVLASASEQHRGDHQPSAPQPAREERRQHPPGRRASGADEDHDPHRGELCGLSRRPSQLSLPVAVDVQPSATTPAALRAKPSRSGEADQVGREVTDPLIDDRASALLSGRVRRIKACISRRWGGPRWAHEVLRVFANPKCLSPTGISTFWPCLLPARSEARRAPGGARSGAARHSALRPTGRVAAALIAPSRACSGPR